MTDLQGQAKVISSPLITFVYSSTIKSSGHFLTVFKTRLNTVASYLLADKQDYPPSFKCLPLHGFTLRPCRHLLHFQVSSG
jgi:hypothetical protein